ncbi:hypothetical protein L345_02014, partial [Ophiophagus hannah]
MGKFELKFCLHMDLLTAKEYHCLLQLLCPDFPVELTQKAARSCLKEFIENVAAIYQELLTGKNPNTVIVPTSSSGQHRSRQTVSECSPVDGVEASAFYQCLESLCDKSKYRDWSTLEIFSCKNKLRIQEMEAAEGWQQPLFAHLAFGALPEKAELLFDPVMDQELEKLIASISGLSVSNSSASGDATNLPSRASPRICSLWRPLHHRRKVDTESDGSTEETDSSEN